MLQLRNTKAYNCEVRSRTIFLWIILNDMKSLSSLRFEVYSFYLTFTKTLNKTKPPNFQNASFFLQNEAPNVTNFIHVSRFLSNQPPAWGPWYRASRAFHDALTHTHRSLKLFAFTKRVTFTADVLTLWWSQKPVYWKKKGFLRAFCSRILPSVLFPWFLQFWFGLFPCWSSRFMLVIILSVSHSLCFPACSGFSVLFVMLKVIHWMFAFLPPRQVSAFRVLLLQFLTVSSESCLLQPWTPVLPLILTPPLPLPLCSNFHCYKKLISSGLLWFLLPDSSGYS